MSDPLPAMNIAAYKRDPIRREMIDARLEELSSDPVVQEIKSLLREKLYYGSECPACTQNVKMHKHSIRRVLLVFASQMYRLYGHGPWKLDEELRRVYVDCPFEPTGVEMLRQVGIIEGATKTYDCADWPGCGKKDKHPHGHEWSRGVWAITEYGAELLSDSGEFPEALYYYNRKPFAISAETASYSTAPDEVGFGMTVEDSRTGSAA